MKKLILISILGLIISNTGHSHQLVSFTSSSGPTELIEMKVREIENNKYVLDYYSCQIMFPEKMNQYKNLSFYETRNPIDVDQCVLLGSLPYLYLEKYLSTNFAGLSGIPYLLEMLYPKSDSPMVDFLFFIAPAGVPLVYGITIPTIGVASLFLANGIDKIWDTGKNATTALLILGTTFIGGSYLSSKIVNYINEEVLDKYLSIDTPQNIIKSKKYLRALTFPMGWGRMTEIPLTVVLDDLEDAFSECKRDKICHN